MRRGFIFHLLKNESQTAGAMMRESTQRWKVCDNKAATCRDKTVVELQGEDVMRVDKMAG